MSDPNVNQEKREPLPVSPEEESGTPATDRNEELGLLRRAEESPEAGIVTPLSPTVPTPGAPSSPPEVEIAAIERDEAGKPILMRVVSAPPGKPEGEVDTR
ncbi:hypothetical protein [Rhizohabitans arisaemae]|uniref:hypothetical protein n=1 Tax=Rhizohabitans arisaemae TaxID=2720610 RepID=UPI0024B23043|nr:hypothetical protein [Rhizohabitans arisaemae]